MLNNPSSGRTMDAMTNPVNPARRAYCIEVVLNVSVSDPSGVKLTKAKRPSSADSSGRSEPSSAAESMPPHSSGISKSSVAPITFIFQSKLNHSKMRVKKKKRKSRGQRSRECLFVFCFVLFWMLPSNFHQSLADCKSNWSCAGVVGSSWTHGAL